LVRRSFAALSFSLASACRSISSCTIFALDFVDLLRQRIDGGCAAGAAGLVDQVGSPCRAGSGP